MTSNRPAPATRIRVDSFHLAHVAVGQFDRLRVCLRAQTQGWAIWRAVMFVGSNDERSRPHSGLVAGSAPCFTSQLVCCVFGVRLGGREQADNGCAQETADRDRKKHSR